MNMHKYEIRRPITTKRMNRSRTVHSELGKEIPKRIVMQHGRNMRRKAYMDDHDWGDDILNDEHRRTQIHLGHTPKHTYMIQALSLIHI